MKKKKIESSLNGAYVYINKLATSGRTGCFDSPVVPSSCPTFDEKTAEYIRDAVRLYIISYITPAIEDCLEELSK